MVLDLDGVGVRQPLTRNVRPTICQCQQGRKFLKPRFLSEMCFFQTEASGLQAPKQCFDFPSLAVIRENLLRIRTACHNHVLTFRSTPPHQRHRFTQDSALTHQQSANASLLCAKQISSRHHFSAPSVGDFQVLFDSQAKGLVGRAVERDQVETIALQPCSCRNSIGLTQLKYRVD